MNPDLLHVLQAGSRFVPYCHVPVKEWKPIYPNYNDAETIKIGQAPSDRNVKGTGKLLSCLKELKSDGYKFELVIIEGLSNTDALRAIGEIDVLIDQIFAGRFFA